MTESELLSIEEVRSRLLEISSELADTLDRDTPNRKWRRPSRTIGGSSRSLSNKPDSAAFSEFVEAVRKKGESEWYGKGESPWMKNVDFADAVSERVSGTSLL